MCRKIKGFTLLELLIVVSIVALLFSLLIPMYSSYQSRLAVQNSAQMIVVDLTHMRQKAISLERLAGLVLYKNPGDDDYYSYYTFWDQLRSSGFSDLRQTTGGVKTYKDVNLKELFQTMVSLSMGTTNTVIYFDPTTTNNAGDYWSIVTPSWGTGTTYSRWLTDGDLITITSGNYTYTVKLSKEGIPSVVAPSPAP